MQFFVQQEYYSYYMIIISRPPVAGLCGEEVAFPPFVPLSLEPYETANA